MKINVRIFVQIRISYTANLSHLHLLTFLPKYAII